MSTPLTVTDLLTAFDNFTPEQQHDAIKELAPKFYALIMNDKSLMQEMMPTCMDAMATMNMMTAMNFPMRGMMGNF